MTEPANRFLYANDEHLDGDGKLALTNWVLPDAHFDDVLLAAPPPRRPLRHSPTAWARQWRISL